MLKWIVAVMLLLCGAVCFEDDSITAGAIFWCTAAIIIVFA